ncbi:hypothetical protein OS493_015730 [Desmophyllum pertusum]|uniref:Uncharacterized protein n=1 Tax=Desmophyllum pertusum TaxID=174260 RepID=A0A9X0CL08_9CNID|nr:hypothetical protein OS493_015730 [Desmophyllum pertusum]
MWHTCTELLSGTTNQFQEKIDNRLTWLTQHLGGTGDKLRQTAATAFQLGVQWSLSFSLKGNVKVLHQEKMLIDSGRRQLKEMAKTVKEKLENVTKEFQKQDVDAG